MATNDGGQVVPNGVSVRVWLALNGPYKAEQAVRSLDNQGKPSSPEAVAAEIVRLNLIYADAMIAATAVPAV